ncbi:MAG: bifunctional demethylmenaquinone methyltransferase/2-methoxy-6-polyprenyl-1,4-benzoquinol methylase UbiE [bacterium]
MAEFEFTSTDEKKSYVRTMFSDIAGRYDFLNHLLSFGLDYYWRRSAVKLIRAHLSNVQNPRILDIACGTGDLSFEVLHQIPDAKITGIDLAKPMLEIFSQKSSERNTQILIEEGDVEAMRFTDNSFDAIVIGFATRNFSQLEKAFTEIYRVLKPGGIFINLELSIPRHQPMKGLYKFYSRIMLPIIGKMISRNSEAYTYLPDSIRRFPEHNKIIAMLSTTGFIHSRWQDLSGGIVTMHIGQK